MEPPVDTKSPPVTLQAQPLLFPELESPSNAPFLFPHPTSICLPFHHHVPLQSQ